MTDDDRDDFFNPFAELGKTLQGKKPGPTPGRESGGTARLPAASRRAARDDDAAMFLAHMRNTGTSRINRRNVMSKEEQLPPPEASAPEAGVPGRKADSAPRPAPAIPAQGKDDDDAFARAMSGVRPIEGKGRDLSPPAPKKAAPPPAWNRELDFLQGKFEFALEYTDEFYEGHVLGLDPLVIAKLRAGQYSPESHIDLHGLNSEQAYAALLDFIRTAYNKGQRSLVVVTGRGKNSPGGDSILRRQMQSWLTHDPLKRVVLAFSTAQPKDGGRGALYLLLRKFKKSNGKIRWDRTPTEESPIL